MFIIQIARLDLQTLCFWHNHKMNSQHILLELLMTSLQFSLMFPVELVFESQGVE